MTGWRLSCQSHAALHCYLLWASCIAWLPRGFVDLRICDGVGCWRYELIVLVAGVLSCLDCAIGCLSSLALLSKNMRTISLVCT